MKTLPQLKKELESLINAYVRERDEGMPCISCGQRGYLQAGHFYPVSTYGGLRYELDNINGECPICNCYTIDHLDSYEKNLKLRIGEDRFMILQQKAQQYKKTGYKFSRNELLELIINIKQKTYELKQSSPFN